MLLTNRSAPPDESVLETKRTDRWSALGMGRKQEASRPDDHPTIAWRGLVTAERYD
jgi:hypothetical protein